MSQCLVLELVLPKRLTPRRDPAQTDTPPNFEEEKSTTRPPRFNG